MMLEEISNSEKLLAKLNQGAVNLVPTCRALEADIVCELQTFDRVPCSDSLRSKIRLWEFNRDN